MKILASVLAFLGVAYAVPIAAQSDNARAVFAMICTREGLSLGHRDEALRRYIDECVAAKMKVSFTIFFLLFGLSFAHLAVPIGGRSFGSNSIAHPFADLNPIEERAPDSDADSHLVTSLKPIEERESDDIQSIEGLDAQCVRCIKRECTRAAGCLALIAATAVVPCLLTFCAAASAFCCVFD